MKPENVKCPVCEGPMVRRANKSTGQKFFGCKKYPECKGTRNTDGESPSEARAIREDDDNYPIDGYKLDTIAKAKRRRGRD